jgi:hypothetical protein
MQKSVCKVQNWESKAANDESESGRRMMRSSLSLINDESRAVLINDERLMMKAAPSLIRHCGALTSAL